MQRYREFASRALRNCVAPVSTVLYQRRIDSLIAAHASASGSCLRDRPHETPVRGRANATRACLNDPATRRSEPVPRGTAQRTSDRRRPYQPADKGLSYQRRRAMVNPSSPPSGASRFRAPAIQSTFPGEQPLSSSPAPAPCDVVSVSSHGISSSGRIRRAAPAAGGLAARFAARCHEHASGCIDITNRRAARLRSRSAVWQASIIAHQGFTMG